MMKTIKTKITVIVVICSVISSLICGGMCLVRVGNKTVNDSESNMVIQGENHSKEINKELSQISQSVDILASITTTSIKDFNKFKKSQKVVDEYTKEIAPIALQFANKTEGALTYYIRYNPDFTSPTSGIFASRESDDEKFTSLKPTDFSTYAKDDLEHVGWYYIPVNNKKATWMNPYLNSNINVYMISYVVPIFINGESVGIVGMDIDFSKIQKLVDNSKAFDDGYAFLTNADNTISYHKDLELGHDITKSDSGLESLVKLLNDDDKQNETEWYEYNGEKKIASYYKLQNGMKFVQTATNDDMMKAAKGIFSVIVLAILIAIALSILVGYFISLKIANPIKTITSVITDTANLDFTSNTDDRIVKMKDETGNMARAVKSMNEKLVDMVKQIDTSSKDISETVQFLNTSIYEINDMCSDNSATVQQLSASMQETAAETQQIDTNIESITEYTSRIVKLSKDGEDTSRTAKQRADQLEKTTITATEFTRNMYNEVRNKAKKAMEQAKAVEKINSLTNEIMEISSQTNLLALNASIESARAGEAGKGFAVVANEIDSLATQTQRTVQNIESIIQEVNLAVNNMKECLYDSTEFLEKTVLNDYMNFMKVGEQYTLDAENYEEGMKQIFNSVSSLIEMMQEITNAIQEINITINNSSQGITVIAEKTCDIVAKMSDADKMVNNSDEKVKELKNIVEQFKI